MTQTRLASRTSEGQAELYNAVKAMAVRFDFKPASASTRLNWPGA